MSNLLFTRKSKDYTNNSRMWEENESGYKGGEEHILRALIPHVSEIKPEYEERRRRAHYVNYPRAIATQITSYALAVEPTREGADEDLLADFSRTGDRCNIVMRRVSTWLTVYGKVWIYVGMPFFEGENNLERRKREKLLPFAQVLTPLEVQDYAEGEDGGLLWATIREEFIHKSDPFSQEVKAQRIRLWTREKWELYENLNGTVRLIQSGENALGRVPLIQVTEPDLIDPTQPHWFNDVVRISNSILNAGSESQMNIIKQMFGLLVVSESFMRSAERVPRRKEENPDSGKTDFAAAISRSFAVCETDQEKGITRYIAPSGAETAAIRQECDALKIEMYEVVGLAMQSRSREAQSSESKSWDFQNVSQFLANRADLLESVEQRIWAMMNAWDPLVPIPSVTYNRKFAVKDLEKNIAGLLQLSNMPNAGMEYSKQVLRSALEQLNEITEVPADKYNAILAEIDATQPAPVPSFRHHPQEEDPEAGTVDNDSTNNYNTGEEQ